MPKFTDRERLDALLEVANQIEQASIVTSDQELSFSVTMEKSGNVNRSFDVFDKEPFRSLSMSVRLAYQNDEPANFGSVCSVLHKIGSPKVREIAGQLREEYNKFLNGHRYEFHLHGDLEGTVVHTRELFETWLYGRNFHQSDSNRRAMYAELEKFGPAFTLAVQDVAMEVVTLILNLAQLVSIALSEQEGGGSKPSSG